MMEKNTGDINDATRHISISRTPSKSNIKHIADLRPAKSHALHEKMEGKKGEKKENEKNKKY